MEGLIIAVALVCWLALLVLLLIVTLEEKSWLVGSLFFVVLIGGFGFMIQQAINEEDSGPCLKEETALAYNAATKTMMPYTRCVERGVWVKE